MSFFKGEKLSHEPGTDDNPDRGSGAAKLRYQENLRRQREGLSQEPPPDAKAERINKTARETLERLKKISANPKSLNPDSEPHDQNLFD